MILLLFPLINTLTTIFLMLQLWLYFLHVCLFLFMRASDWQQQKWERELKLGLGDMDTHSCSSASWQTGGQTQYLNIVLNNFYTLHEEREVINFLLSFSNISLEQLTSDKNRPQFHRNIITFTFYDFVVIWIKSCWMMNPYRTFLDNVVGKIIHKWIINIIR